MITDFDDDVEKVQITGEYLCELYDREEETLLNIQRLINEQLSKLQVRQSFSKFCISNRIEY